MTIDDRFELDADLDDDLDDQRDDGPTVHDAGAAGWITATGGVLVAASALFPWVTVAAAPDTEFGGVEIDLGTSLQQGLDPTLRSGIVVCALVVVGAGVFLTRARRLRVGLGWRALGLAALVLPGLAAAWAWQVVAGVGGGLPTLGGGSVVRTVNSFLESAPAVRSLFVLRPALGMWLATFGLLLALVGLFLPSARDLAAEPD